MGPGRISAWHVLSVTLAAILAFVALVYFARGFLLANADLVTVAKDLATALGLAGAVVAAFAYVTAERQRQGTRTLERVKLTVDLMARFYEPSDLEEIRRSLREHTELSRPANHPRSLRWDEVWVMNFFEALAISVDEGFLDIALVNKMLGSPIVEVGVNPNLRPLVYNEKARRIYSYERFCTVLYEPICRLRGHEPWPLQ
jgi:hypothetical protein